MNSTQPAPRRRLWPWILLAVICLPFLVVAAVTASFLTLDRDAAALRRHVMRATGADWDTKVQVSAGRFSIGLVRAGLACVQNDEIEDAKLALRAIHSASVGVYQRQSGAAEWSSAELINDTDAEMRRRGWLRVVGVSQGRDTVMVYVPDGDEEPEDVCVAVVNDRDFVVVSARIRPSALVALVERHAEGKLGLGRAVTMASAP